MEQLPVYIEIVFILTTLLGILLLYKASGFSKPVIIIVLLWLAFQSVLGLSGFYTITNVAPPRFSLVLFPSILLIAFMFFSKSGKCLIDRFDIKYLTLFHIVRVPVELTLFWLFLHKVVPEIMTFEGRNFDIFCGLTAPFIFYFGYIKNALSRSFLIAWNVICLLLLANIVVTAILSAPFPFQQFAFDQPNIAMLYFPYILLPGFLVPAVLFAHLVTIRRLLSW